MLRAPSRPSPSAVATRCPARTAFLAALALLLLAGCSRSSGNPATAAPEASIPAQPTTAKNALGPLYNAAHRWASDAVLLRMTAKEISGYTNNSGNAALWEASFGSPSAHTVKIFRYAIATVPPDTARGVAGGAEKPWGGITPDAQPIELYDFNTDSDAAYQIAYLSATAWLKKNPGQPLTRQEIGNNGKYPVPTWSFTWGDQKSGYVAIVDATNSRLLRHR